MQTQLMMLIQPTMIHTENPAKTLRMGQNPPSSKLPLILQTFCTGTCHCRAQEHIDNQHDEEQDTKSYAEIQKPNWSYSTSLTNIRNFN